MTLNSNNSGLLFYLECPPNSTVSSCGRNTLCLQTSPGIYNCSCKSGYSGGYDCTDIDECTTGQYQCNVNSTCVNTIGSYTCQCKFGYFGNGTTCDGKTAIRLDYENRQFKVGATGWTGVDMTTRTPLSSGRYLLHSFSVNVSLTQKSDERVVDQSLSPPFVQYLLTQQNPKLPLYLFYFLGQTPPPSDPIRFHC